MIADGAASRVRQLIVESGSTQSQFAEQLGMDTTKLSKSLNGQRRFTSLELALIAQAAGVTVDWLLNGETNEALAARFAPDDSGRLTGVRAEARRLAESRENLAFLGRAREFPQPKPFISSLWTEQGEELANYALGILGAPQADTGTESFSSAIERGFGIDVCIIDTQGSCDGLAFQTGDARILIAATSRKPTRQRFTIAHELGHLLCGDDQAVHIDQDIMSPESRQGAAEKRANAFAAALLMPEPVLQEGFAERASGSSDAWFCELSMRLKVSPSALAWRLFNVNVINAAERRKLGSMRTIDCANALGKVTTFSSWLEDSAQPRGPEALVSDVLQAYLAGVTTLQPLANLVRTDVATVRSAIEDALVITEESDDFVP